MILPSQNILEQNSPNPKVFCFKFFYVKGSKLPRGVHSFLRLVLQGSWMFGFPGTGGQLAYGDLDHGLGFAFLTNRLYGGLNAYSPQGRAMVEATYDVLRTLMQQDGSVESWLVGGGNLDWSHWGRISRFHVTVVRLQRWPFCSQGCIFEWNVCLKIAYQKGSSTVYYVSICDIVLPRNISTLFECVGFENSV